MPKRSEHPVYREVQLTRQKNRCTSMKSHPVRRGIREAHRSVVRCGEMICILAHRHVQQSIINTPDAMVPQCGYAGQMPAHANGRNQPRICIWRREPPTTRAREFACFDSATRVRRGEPVSDECAERHETVITIDDIEKRLHRHMFAGS
ncbi:hypothetical protein ASF06_10795 [Agreia sp. Leaf244]|nr:hypothetical protein ASF06_10795 [Agreia sp. Leaf244]